MNFHFGQLIAHLSKARRVRAGSIIGSSTVSNQNGLHGYSCVAEKRAIECIEHGAPRTAFRKFRDRIREMLGCDGRSVFGVIEQKVVAAP